MYYYWKGIAVEIAALFVNGFRYYVLGDLETRCEVLEHDYRRVEGLSPEVWRVECSECDSVAVDVVDADPVDGTVSYLRFPVETDVDGEPLFCTPNEYDETA